MASTANIIKPISLVDEEDPGIEHGQNEESVPINVDESATPPSNIPTDDTQGTQKPRSTRTPSMVWNHFTKICDTKGNEKAKCNYCGSQYACGSKKNGTSNLINHVNIQCKSYPGRGDKNQAKVCFERLKGEGVNLVTHKYDPETLREYVARMIIKDELPFSFVENEGFRDLFSKAEPRFNIPSRTTITRDVMSLYLKEKNIIKDMFVKKKQRVCLTTDTWKSCQNLNYMCLTAHKYWGKIEDLNPLLLVAIVLDPRYKLPFLNVCFELMCGNKVNATTHCKSVRMTLDSMYKEYSMLDSSDGMCMSSMNVEDDGRDADDDADDEYALFDQLRKKKLKAVDSLENKTEVDKYFNEACENTDQHDFDVLNWWKKNASRFKILSMIAKDVFAIPISTVASESAFSTGGRVIDPYRSRLSPKAVQALICTQNWIRQTTQINLDGISEEVEALEAELLARDGELKMD